MFPQKLLTTEPKLCILEGQTSRAFSETGEYNNIRKSSILGSNGNPDKDQIERNIELGE